MNNNVVSSLDASGREIIIMGRGLGFQKKKGDLVEEAKVEKVFYMESQTSMDKYKDLVAHMPWEYIQVSNEIIAYATKSLNAKLNQNVYLTLTDHINFAIERYKEGMFFPNTIYGEVKRFYPEEFHVAVQALEFIHEGTGIKLPKEEAASIAIHLINAEFHIKVRDSFRMTNVIQDIVTILEDVNYIPEGDSLNRDQLLSNLKFLAHRMLLLVPQETQADDTFFAFIKTHCEEEFKVASQIETMVQERYNCQMTRQEKSFLTVMLKSARPLAKNNGAT
jgi:beta-glucoside operon transcriptional antiterminator